MLRKKRPPLPGDLFYYSERKYDSPAPYLRLKSGSLQSNIEFEVGAKLSGGVPVVGRVATEAAIRGKHSDHGRHEKALLRQLERIPARFGSDRLVNLETTPGDLREGGWFRFHRKLRFGVGCADSLLSTKALIVVDEIPVPDGLSIPGLLMNESTAHVRTPYATEELRNAAGKRSGSRSEHLFA